jgi:poly(3-hydroxybutyrate) depolymerase
MSPIHGEQNFARAEERNHHDGVMKPRLRFIAVFLLAAALVSAAESLTAGNGRFQFSGWDGAALTVWYHAPTTLTPATPIVFVMHGQLRNGDEYRDQWADLARQYGFLLLVPTFSNADFPGFESYNYGNVIGPDGQRRPASLWAFTAVERLFDYAKSIAGITAPTYFIYGHSAGAQFVHRLFFFLPEARAARVMSANAGAYMIPDFEIAHPYGLKGSGITEADLKIALRRPVLVLLGEADMDPNHRPMPRTPEAMLQGIHRFSRGLNYFRIASEQTVRLGVPFGWKIATVPDVAHNNTLMAPHAARHFFAK